MGVATFGVTVPLLRPLFPSVTLANLIKGAGCPDPAVAAAGYHEPSLVFLAGTNTRLADGASAADFLQAGGCRLALVEQRHERAFAARAEAIGLRYTLWRREEAINYNGGRQISIAIYRPGLN
jgi:hypothetical protein